MAKVNNTQCKNTKASRVAVDCKKCNECGQTKSIREFYINRIRKDGTKLHDSKCKPCKVKGNKRKCFKCGGEASRSNVQCFECWTGKTKDDLRKERDRRQEESRQHKLLAQEKVKRKSRLLPIAGVVRKCSECGVDVIRRRHSENVFCNSSCLWRHNRRNRRARNRAAFVSEVKLSEI